MKRILLTSGALIVAFTGCSKAPEPLVQQTKATPPTEVIELAGSSLPLEATPPEAGTDRVDTSERIPQYTKPETQAAVEDYTQRWQQLEADGQAGASLGNVDPLTNPAAITDYANRIGTDANALDQSERAAKGLMKPEEKKRFRAFQKELDEAGNDR